MPEPDAPRNGNGGWIVNKFTASIIAACFGMAAYVHISTVNGLRSEVVAGDTLNATNIAAQKVQINAIESAALVPRIAMIETNQRATQEATARDVAEIKANLRELNAKVDDLRIEKAKGT